MSVSRDDLEEQGWAVSENGPDDGSVPWINPRTGETLQVPRGIDPGWAYNPGNTDAAAHVARVAMDKLADLPPKMGAAAISALAFAFPQVERELEDWIHSFIDMAKDGVYHATGSRRVVGALSDDVLKFLETRDIRLQTAAISISDMDIFHAMRTAKVNPLPKDIWMKLPSFLTEPESIYWDIRKPGLVYVFPSLKGYGKIIVLINYSTVVEREKIVTNTVRTGRIVFDLSEFENTGNYVRIR